ncbi:MAG: hypothetical protein ACI9QL_001304 [Candidatus Omnitrophota bacterium]|jgi:hypothetical protein
MRKTFPPLILRHRWLILLALVSLGLRLSMLTWGTGIGEHAGIYHPDEHKAWRSMTNFPGNYLNNHRFEYGTALQYTLAIVCYPFNLGWGKLGPLMGGLDRIEFNILTFRFVNCLFGVGCIFLIFNLGRKLYDELTAWLAAGLVAFGFYHVVNSPICSLDVPMSFFVTLLLLMVPWAFGKKTHRAFVLLGLATGYLIGMKIYAFFIGIIPLVYLLGAILADRRRWWEEARSWIPFMLTYAGVAIATTFISTPHIFLNFPEYVAWMTSRPDLWFPGEMHDGWRIRRGWGLAFNEMYTPLLAWVPVAGVFFSYPGRTHPWFKCWLSMPILVLAILLFWGGWIPARYLLFISTILALFTARMLAWMIQRRSLAARSLAWGFAVFILMWNVRSIAIAMEAKIFDTRTTASAYLDEHLPEGARITMANAPDFRDWHEHEWRYPQIQADRYQQVSILEEPDYIITNGVNLIRMWRALLNKDKHLDGDYNWQGKGWWLDKQVPTPAEFRFYQDLLFDQQRYELVQTWPAELRVKFPFSGPEIRLYRKKS